MSTTHNEQFPLHRSASGTQYKVLPLSGTKKIILCVKWREDLITLLLSNNLTDLYLT